MKEIEIIKLIGKMQEIPFITNNTLENLWNKREQINDETILNIQNKLAVILTSNEVLKDELKNKIVQSLSNELEQYVSQL